MSGTATQPMEGETTQEHKGSTPTKKWDDVEADTQNVLEFEEFERSTQASTFCVYAATSHTFEGVNTTQGLADTLTSIIKSAGMIGRIDAAPMTQPVMDEPALEYHTVTLFDDGEAQLLKFFGGDDTDAQRQITLQHTKHMKPQGEIITMNATSILVFFRKEGIEHTPYFLDRTMGERGELELGIACLVKGIIPLVAEKANPAKVAAGMLKNHMWNVWGQLGYRSEHARPNDRGLSVDNPVASIELEYDSRTSWPGCTEDAANQSTFMLGGLVVYLLVTFRYPPTGGDAAELLRGLALVLDTPTPARMELARPSPSQAPVWTPTEVKRAQVSWLDLAPKGRRVLITAPYVEETIAQFMPATSPPLRTMFGV